MIHFKFFVGCMLLFFSCSYLPEGPYADIKIDENEDFILLENYECTGSNNILIFYPGGLVDPHSYINKLASLTCINQYVFIAKAPANLMVLDIDIAKKVYDISDGSNTDYNYIIAGHSLGGSMACSFIGNHSDAVNGLILMGSYTTENSSLESWDKTVLSINGTQDEVLDQEKYESNKVFLPPGESFDDISQLPAFQNSNSSIFFDIIGGNHSQYGNYGLQNGDGDSTISDEEHDMIFSELIMKYYSINGWI